LVESLPLFHRVSGQPVVVLGSGDAAQARRRLVERAGGTVIEDLQAGIEKGARLAFIAHEDEEAARADAIRSRVAGLLVNASDRPELCDFAVPSILDRSPLLVAIGTGGASAGLAKALRLRLETLLPQSLGKLASALGAARERLRKRWPAAADRRQALDAALSEGGALDPMADDSVDRIDQWIESGEGGSAAGMIEIVLRSADPDELKLREARALGSAALVAYESGVPAAILDRARTDAARVQLGAGEAPAEVKGLTVILRLPSLQQI